MSSQQYRIRNEVASGDQVALEIDWVGTLSSISDDTKGGQMRARFGLFCSSKDGKIISQRNCDSYEP